MSVADDLYQYVTDSGLFSGYRLQVGQFFGGDNQTDKFVVIKPSGGPKIRLVRDQNYSIHIIGPVDSGGYDEIAIAESFADYVAANHQFGTIVGMTPSIGPLVFSAENRPVIEIGLSLIVSL